MVSDIRVIDEKNTEVHVSKGPPMHCWETSLGRFEFNPEEFPSKLKLLYIFIRVSFLTGLQHVQCFLRVLLGFLIFNEKESVSILERRSFC